VFVEQVMATQGREIGLLDDGTRNVIRKTGQGVRAQHSTEHKRKNKEETGRRTAKTPGEHQLPAGALNPPRTPETSPTSKA
jgi:hypothetical protein